MDELKMLIDMVAHLPQMTLYFLTGFLIYKLAMIGSIYGVIRLAINQLHDWSIKKKLEVKEVEIISKIDGMTVRDATDPLLTQLHRLPHISFCDGKGESQRNHTYIHRSDVDWLRDAIDTKLEAKKERAK